MGNLPAVVCLFSACHEEHGLVLLEHGDVHRTEASGHFWKGCHFCRRDMLADPAAFESTALCDSCWDRYVEAGRFPPTTAWAVAAEVQAGKLELGWDQATETLVRVKP